jgi:hypothetical protein
MSSECGEAFVRLRNTNFRVPTLAVLDAASAMFAVNFVFPRL